jgi:hypothetical protein
MPSLVKALVVKCKPDPAAQKVPTFEESKPISILVNDGSSVETQILAEYLLEEGQGKDVKYYEDTLGLIKRGLITITDIQRVNVAPPAATA